MRAPRAERFATTRTLRPTRSPDVVTAATKASLSSLAHRVAVLEAEISALDAMITPLLQETAPELLGVYGVGIDTAAALLVAAGDNPERLRSEAAWAHLCGVSPLEASSGKVTRHRLNRGGDRQANRALWHIVITRLASDPRTKSEPSACSSATSHARSTPTCLALRSLGRGPGSPYACRQ
jgi:transposase